MQFSWFFFFAFFKKNFFYIFYFFADSARRLISFKLYNSWWVCANLHTGYAVSFLNRLFIYSFVVHTRFLELPFSRETTTTTTKKKQIQGQKKWRAIKAGRDRGDVLQWPSCVIGRFGACCVSDALSLSGCHLVVFGALWAVTFMELCTRYYT